MNYINNFRYGEISRKSAGRFDAEYYNQGAFKFHNMVTGSVGGASRRPPLKKLLDVDVLDIREFTISDSISFLIGIGKNKIHLYRFAAGKFVEISSQLYPEYPVGSGNRVVTDVTEKIAREIRTCQYYNRLYFAHRLFRTFYIDLNASYDNFTISAMTVILNQDGKKEFYFTPSYVANDKEEELPGQEKRLVYKNTDGKWYFDREFTDEYLYAITYPPKLGEKAFINGYEDAPDDVLMTGEGHYPSEVACINDCLYMSGTDREPHVVWKSRVIGSSQYFDGYTPDSMHDFTTFHSVITEGKDLVDSTDIPQVDMKDANGNTVYETDGRGQLIYYGKDGDGKEIRLYWKPKSSDPNDSGKLFYIDKDCSVAYDNASVSPYNKPLKMYDLSDPEKLLITVCRVDFVATDSCGDKIEMNTGKQDRVMFIRPSCGRIIIGTTSSEETLPSNYSPVSNRQREHYGDFGSKSSYSIAPICMNSSLYFVQRSNTIREFYLYQGFMSNGDVTLINHDAMQGNVVSLCCKNTPDPMLYAVMEDGTLRAIHVDKDNGIMSLSRWDTSNGSIKSLAKIMKGDSEVVAALVERNGSKTIAFFDEAENDIFSDFYDASTASGDGYISEIETTYAEIIDNQILGFGAFKKANTAFMRCYHTGHVVIGDDERMMMKTSYPVGDEDYRIPLTGTAKLKYSVIIKAVGNEPMNILAFGYEVMKR